MSTPMLSPEKNDLLWRGVAIPASPLALDAHRRLDETHQRAVYRYYVAAGSGGVAVGVHTTQFEIRDPGVGLFKPLLDIAADELSTLEKSQGRPLLKIAGVCGTTDQAIQEADYAASRGYDAALLSLAALRDATEDKLICHCREVANVLPLIGFYLQPAVGGRVLSHDFWCRFSEMKGVVAIKIAPFNRYQTLDVVRAVALTGNENRIALYTGNDDNILVDLLTPFRVSTPTGDKILRMRGGLLGQWAVWTHTFVRLLDAIHRTIDEGDLLPFDLLRMNAELTDANAVIFDAANGFKGCIPGINEILRRQGLLPTSHCLNPSEVLSPGQGEAIDRICREYPWLLDDEFVTTHLDGWMR